MEEIIQRLGGIIYMKILSTRDDKTRAFFNFIPSFHSPVLSITLFFFYSSLYLQEVFEYTAKQGRRKQRRRKCNEACFDNTGIPLGNVFLKCRCPLAISAPERRETVFTEEASLRSGFCVTVDLFSV